MKPEYTSGRGLLSRKNRVLLAALLALWVAGLQIARADNALKNNPVLIQVQELKSLPENQAVLIDTRSSWRYFLGHIPGAVNLNDWQDFTVNINGSKGMLNENPAFIVNRLQSLGVDKSKRIVVYGDSSDPWRTDGRFFWMFERYGFSSVSLLEGGLEAWKRSGARVERGKSRPNSPSKLSIKDIRLNPDVVADSKWVKDRLNSGNIAIIDNRTKKEYDGATPYGSSRGGHIPKAVHIHWPEFFTGAGNLKNREALTGILDRYGIRSENEIVVYCTGGVRSAMAYFVFRYLGFSVRNYDGSWWDWSRQPNLPVEVF